MFMEKTTKKRSKKKALKKRIGIIAVGGLSLVLTVCLSVGATLAWFAGSSWASKSMYMGGPVYVEMAGRNTDNEGVDSTKWVGGQGNLDIQAFAGRTTGYGSTTGDAPSASETKDVLLPGQKIEIYSQARVFSTASTDTITDGAVKNTSSGADTTNTSNGVVTYQTDSGRITSTTSAVLRARFSIDIEFDPSVGFNNFTTADYMENYPQQSASYTGDVASSTTEYAPETTGIAWADALGADALKADASGEFVVGARRDAVAIGNWSNSDADLAAIQATTKKSIYKWRYCSKTEWDAAGTDAATSKDGKNMKMAAPFDGSDKTKNANGYYGIWVTDTTTGEKTESAGFYKARCNAYLDSYVEFYENEYGNYVTRTIASSISALDRQFNQYFVKLVNDSSDAMLAGTAAGVGNAGNRANVEAIPATWLYIDPSIGNDTNSDELSTSTGGWWYLVEAVNTTDSLGSDGKGASAVKEVIDSFVRPETKDDGAPTTNTIDDTQSFVRYSATPDTGKDEKNIERLNAKLYEVKNFYATETKVGRNYKADGSYDDIVKVVSQSFPFVNGTFALPTDALTNIFANAKITFKIAFQAVQAFFPFTESIDNIGYTNPLLGTGKALNIKNAINIYNEAFDYQEDTMGEVSGM